MTEKKYALGVTIPPIPLIALIALLALFSTPTLTRLIHTLGPPTCTSISNSHP